MIIPMKKIALLCLSTDKTSALEVLRNCGIVHVTTAIRDSAEIRQSVAHITALRQAKQILSILQKDGRLTIKPDAASPVATWSIQQLLDYVPGKYSNSISVNRTAEVITRLQEEATMLKLEEKKYSPFGNITPEKIKKLADDGLEFKLVRGKTGSDFVTEENETFLETSRDSEYFYGAWLSDKLHESLEVYSVPEISTAKRSQLIALSTQKADELRQGLKAVIAEMEPKLDAEEFTLSESAMYVSVSENMQISDKIAHLQGYIPERETETLQKTAKENSWGIIVSEPDADAIDVPVLLEPPKIFRSITSLFKGLNILPAYSETDISVPFYIFFTIFFAMLIGDAGYGLLILAAVLFAKFKTGNKPKNRPIFTIFTVFSVSAICWGILSGTYFGLSAARLPDCLTSLPTVAWLGNQNNIMQLCFILGSSHLTCARLWNVIQLAPDTKALAQLGWIGVIWAMYCVICGIVIDGFSQPVWTWWLMGVSILLIMLFMVKPSELKKNGAELGMLPLNVISSMGDIISYVRLFAVGLASVKVADNFNEMALNLDLPLAVKIPAVIFILLLGHGINMASGALGILVHAVRLNTLEFSNAKGITWSGTPYRPFSSSNNSKNN